MSYASAVKNEILNIKIKLPCCKKAFIYGLLLNSIINDNTESVELQLNNKLNAETLSDLFAQYFRCKTNIFQNAISGRVEYVVSIMAASAIKIAKQCQFKDISDFPDCALDFYNIIDFKCESCKNFFLAGAFVSCASISDPKNSYHLEFVLKNKNAANALRDILKSVNFVPKDSSRLYFKKAETISEFLAYIGAKKNSFEIINLQIERDIRNHENRVTNCVTQNISKTITASMIQLDAITLLLALNEFDKMPEELQNTARLRLDNPDISLAELARLHKPPITKSGLNHRLTKIIYYAQIKQKNTSE